MAVVIPALDARYVTTVSLDEYFVNKDTGLPLANGKIYFYEDAARNVPKLAYTLTDNPPGYNPPNYTPLPNPITLSTVGTVADNNGNNVPIYYFPYDAAGNLQLYYIVVTDQFGTVQETRHAWPNIAAASNPSTQSGTFSNALSNPQFTQYLFSPNNPLTITNSAGAGTFQYLLFPDWALNVGWSGNGTIVINRTAVTGVSAYPGNPPYTITITPGINITSIVLKQRLLNNPDIFSANAAGTGGYISASILLAPGSSILNMQYSPNDTGAQTSIILMANNTSGSFAEFTQTTQLPPALNTNTADTGFVDIIINLPIGQPTTLSNVQIVGLEANIQGITWAEYPANRQADQLFNYWQAPINFKPIRSYLIGWDFPLNPGQFLGRGMIGPFATGNNSSFYAWDQTIIFQSATNGVTVRTNVQGTLGMQITANVNTQFATIQYLTQSQARALLQNNLSVNISAGTAKPAGIPGTVSLWYTSNANLPSTVGANQSLVTALDANGFPTVVAGWNQVPRNVYGNASFILTTRGTFNYPSMGYNGWSVNGSNVIGTTTFFAIVVGFSLLTAADQVDFLSVSLVPGDIPTIPAPQTFAEVLLDCSHFYQKSFSNAVVPAAGTGINTGELQFLATVNGGNNNRSQAVNFQNMVIPPVVTFYNPNTAANSFAYDISNAVDTTGTATLMISNKAMSVNVVGAAGSVVNDRLAVHYTLDSRLGQ